MKPIVKICGLSTSESVAAAVEAGATHLGFIFFDKSPRNVAPAKAAELLTGLTNNLAESPAGSFTRPATPVETVAVTVNANDITLEQIVRTVNPTLLQLHGSETPARVADVKARFGLPVIKAIAVRDADDLDRAKTYENVADLLLLDAKPPEGSRLPGGNGVSFDWGLVEDFKSDTPLLLSGGIDLDNAQAALNLVKGDENSFAGLDVSSGVESAPGVKDISKITAFLAACGQQPDRTGKLNAGKSNESFL